MEKSKKQGSRKYVKLSGKVGLHLATITALIVGVSGVIMCVGGGIAMLFGYAGSTILTGVFFSLALLPGLYRSGVELDIENKRFREYNGPLGRSKEAWIDVEEEDYLSIVGFSQSRGTVGGIGRVPRRTAMTMSMSRVYFWSGEWHLEVFKGHYEDALVFARKFAKEYSLSINDVNKDQDLPEVSNPSYY